MAPNAPAELDFVDMQHLQQAQHMWVKGGTLEEIATACRMTVEAAQTYLAYRRSAARSEEPRFDGNLRAMIGRALTGIGEHRVITSLAIRPGQDPCVETEIHEADSYEELANIRRFSPSSQIFRGRADLLALIEPANAAAWFWYQKMRRNLAEVGLNLFAVSREGQDDLGAEVRAALDFRPFSTPMLDLLSSLLPADMEPYAEYNHRLEVRLGGSVSIVHHEGGEWRQDSRSRKLRKTEAAALWPIVRDFNVRHRDDLEHAGYFTLFVEGGQLKRRNSGFATD